MEHLTRPELVESIIVQEKIKFELELKVITDADNADAYKKVIDAVEAKINKYMEAFGDAKNDVTPRVGAGDDTYASNVNQVGGAGTHVSVAKGNNGKSAVHAVVPQVKWKQKQHAKVNLGTTTQTCSGKATTQTCSGKATTQTCSGNATIQTCSGIATTQTCSGKAMNGDNADSYNENYAAYDNATNVAQHSNDRSLLYTRILHARKRFLGTIPDRQETNNATLGKKSLHYISYVLSN